MSSSKVKTPRTHDYRDSNPYRHPALFLLRVQSIDDEGKCDDHYRGAKSAANSRRCEAGLGISHRERGTYQQHRNKYNYGGS